MSDFYETESLLAVSSSDVGWIVGGCIHRCHRMAHRLHSPQQTGNRTSSASTTKKATCGHGVEERRSDVEVEEDDFNLQIDEVVCPKPTKKHGRNSGETIESTTIEVIERIEEAVEEEPTAMGGLRVSVRRWYRQRC